MLECMKAVALLAVADGLGHPDSLGVAPGATTASTAGRTGRGAGHGRGNGDGAGAFAVARARARARATAGVGGAGRGGLAGGALRGNRLGRSRTGRRGSCGDRGHNRDSVSLAWGARGTRAGWNRLRRSRAGWHRAGRDRTRRDGLRRNRV